MITFEHSMKPDIYMYFLENRVDPHHIASEEVL